MPNNTLREELQLMAMAAHLYYEDGLTQQEVAKAMKLSRPTISRLLIRAREEHIVTITVTDPLDNDRELADRLCQATGLSEAIITPAVPGAPDLNLKRLGISAARYLERTIQSQDVIGVGWGRTLYAVVQSLQAKQVSGVTLVPLTGGLGQISPHFQVNELIRIISENFEGVPHQLFLPAIVQHEETKASLLASEDSLVVTKIWNNLTLALVGIGNVDFETEMRVLFVNYLDEGTRQRLKATGAVGDICMHFFDQMGQPVLDGLQGVVSISLDQLRRVPNVVAVACGSSKAQAILGAICGGYIRTLLTDDLTAQAILSILRVEKNEHT
jgi:DNA-binding transcriptional regulator LsrR (DeoR family)